MRATERAEVVEKMIRKLRAGMMPPAGAKRPDAATIDALTAALEAAHGRVRGGESQSRASGRRSG